MITRQNSHEKKMKAVTEMIAECIENRTEQWNHEVAAEITKCVMGMKKPEEETLNFLIELLYNDKILDKESNRYQLELADKIAKKHKRVNTGLKTVQQNGGSDIRVINGTINDDCEGDLPTGPRVLRHITPASLYDPLKPATLTLDGVHTITLDSGSVILDLHKMDLRTPTNDVGAKAPC